jgi:hypothetical protein
VLPAHRELPHRGRPGRAGARGRLWSCGQWATCPRGGSAGCRRSAGQHSCAVRRRALVAAGPHGAAGRRDARGCGRPRRPTRRRRGAAAGPAGACARDDGLRHRADPAAAPGERRRLGARDPGPRCGDGRDRAGGGRPGRLGRGPGLAPPHGWRRGSGRRVPGDGDLVPGRGRDRVRGGGRRTRVREETEGRTESVLATATSRSAVLGAVGLVALPDRWC